MSLTGRLSMSQSILEKEKPDVTVIIPAYNVEPYVKDCIDSIKNQTFKSFEAIIINDGSSDNTATVIENEIKDDPRFKLYHQTNKGLAYTRNRGLSLATGEFIYFMDSDDIITSRTLETTVGMAYGENLDVVHFNANIFYEENSPESFFSESNYIRHLPAIPENIYEEMKRTKQYRCPVWLYLVRRQLLTDLDIRFINGIIHEDEAFTLMLICSTTRQGFIGEAFFKRRIREASIMTSTRSLKNAKGFLTTFHHLALWEKGAQIAHPDNRPMLRKHITMFYLISLRTSINIEDLTMIRRYTLKQFPTVLKYVSIKHALAAFFPKRIASILAR